MYNSVSVNTRNINTKSVNTNNSMDAADSKEFAISADTITVFNNPTLGTLRVVTNDGRSWFAMMDLAKVLGYSHGITQNWKRIAREENWCKMLLPTGMGFQSILMVADVGLYQILASSRKNTYYMRKWLANDIIPSLSGEEMNGVKGKESTLIPLTLDIAPSMQDFTRIPVTVTSPSSDKAETTAPARTGGLMALIKGVIDRLIRLESTVPAQPQGEHVA